jgi:glutathione S-transferase
MKYVHIIAILAVVQFVVFSFLVALARQKYGVKAPAIGGHDEFERVFRVQMNTLEQLVCFLPALFLAAHYWSPIFAAVAGVIYLIGRLVYRQSYISDPSTRSLGFLLTIIPTFVLLAAALLGAVVS